MRRFLVLSLLLAQCGGPAEPAQKESALLGPADQALKYPHPVLVHYTDGPAGWCPSPNQFGTGYFNNDSIPDYYCHFWSTGTTQVALGNGNGTYGAPQQWVTNWCGYSSVQTFGVADFNGDGLTDIWCHQGNYNGGTTWIATSSGHDFFGGSFSQAGWCSSTQSFGVINFRQNALPSLWCHDPSGGGTVWVTDSQGFSFGFTYSLWPFCSDSTAAFGFGDFDGDGIQDVFCHTWDGHTVVSHRLLNGSFDTPYDWTQGTFCLNQNGTPIFGVGDFDGDGRADVWCKDPRVGIEVALNNLGWLTNDGTWLPSWCNGGTQTIRGNLGTGLPYDDYNGDGRSDLACLDSTTGNILIALSASQYWRFADGTDWVDNLCSSSLKSINYNFDSRTDLVCLDSFGEPHGVWSNASQVSYHGGNTIYNPKVFMIFYGAWVQHQKDVLWQFVRDLSISNWYGTMADYGLSPTFTPTDFTSDSYSLGGKNPLYTSDLQQIIDNALSIKGWPYDPNAIYLVVTSNDLQYVASNGAGNCGNFCGYHWHGNYPNGAEMRFGVIGDPGTNPNNGCTGTCIPTANKLASPSGLIDVDAMLSTIAHELVETATDPDGDAWHGDTSDRFEAADLCTALYGPVTPVGNGSVYNLQLGTGNKYLVEEIWAMVDGMTGYCGMGKF